MVVLLILSACQRPAPPPPLAVDEVVFVRDGLVVDGSASLGGLSGQALPGSRLLIDQPWTAGQALTLAGQPLTAPLQAECLPVWSIELGDVAPLVTAGGVPDTALAFSPGDGRWLAVGTWRGELLVLDGWTGEVRARRRLSEALIRSLAWAPDGSTLYAAEQSPDAFVRALDPATLEDRWTLRLADRVESSTPPPGEDLYGVYSLPAGFGLAPVGQGELIVAATHGWGGFEGERRNLAQLLRIGADGAVRASWPEQPAEMTLMHPVLDEAKELVLVAVGHSSSRPAPAELPVGGVQILDSAGLSPVLALKPEPLRPWFESAAVWQAMGVSKALDTVLLGLNDGRVLLHGLDGTLRASVGAGAPVMAGDAPVHVGVGWAALSGSQSFYATSPSRIPWGSSSAALRPAAPHPDQNRVASHGLDGTPLWSWQGEHELQGLSLSPDGDELLVGAGARSSDHRRDLYGGLVFATQPQAPSRLRAFCPTEGPVFFQHAMSPDGRLALAEHPFLDEQGRLLGTWRVTVMR